MEESMPLLPMVQDYSEQDIHDHLLGIMGNAQLEACFSRVIIGTLV